MPWEQLSFEQDSVNRIRSMTRTLVRYHATSNAAHRRTVESVYVVASQLGEQVDTIREANPESEKVRIAADKFESVVDSLGLNLVFGE